MSEPNYTLFLWPRGAFPRRIAYQLLIKGIVTSPAAMLAGQSILPNFKINISSIRSIDGAISIVDADPSDPKPQGKSSPCLRIRDQASGTEHFIHESIAISLYLEDAFHSQGFQSMLSTDLVPRAQAVDMVTLVNILGHDFGYYLRHAAPVTQGWSGLADEDRSHGAARNARKAMLRGLVKLQDWAAESLDTTGWMTPGVKGPGVVDVSLAGNLWYIWLGYEFDALQDEKLHRLREWWARFKGLPWWKGLEETGEVHPPELRYPKEVREV